MSDLNHGNQFQPSPGPSWGQSAGAQTYLYAAPGAPKRQGLPVWAILLLVFGGLFISAVVLGIAGIFYAIGHLASVPRAQLGYAFGGVSQPRPTASSLPDLRGTWVGRMQATSHGFVSNPQKAVMLITAQSGDHVAGMLATEGPLPSVYEVQVEGTLSADHQVLHIVETAVIHGPELDTHWTLGSRDLKLNPDGLQASGDGIDGAGARDSSYFSHASNSLAHLQITPVGL